MPFPLSPASLQIQPASLVHNTNTVIRTASFPSLSCARLGHAGKPTEWSPLNLGEMKPCWGKLSCWTVDLMILLCVHLWWCPPFPAQIFCFLGRERKCCQEKDCHCCQDQGGNLLTSSKDTWVKEENWNCIASVFRSYSSGPFTGELCLHHLVRSHGFCGGCKRRISLGVLEKCLHSLACVRKTHTNEWLHRLCTLFLLRVETISLVIIWLQSSCGSEAENPPVGKHIKLLP